jgi:hypothetical protein
MSWRGGWLGSIARAERVTLRFGRRWLLLGSLAAAVGAACATVPTRLAPTAAPTSLAETEAWQAQAQAMLSDALAALRTFEDFAAYRVSITAGSGQRPPSTLAWDPPRGIDWDSATHISRSLHDRASQLFQAITTSGIEGADWRAQREMADASHDLVDLGDSLRAYRDRVDRLPPGDAASALELLDAAWSRWDAVAARWGTARAESVACGAASTSTAAQQSRA